MKGIPPIDPNPKISPGCSCRRPRKKRRTGKADYIYETCVGVLREKTRDRKAFSIVFDENCSYGFRRNLWGLKPLGIALAAATLIASVALVLARTGETAGTGIAVAAGGLAALLGWLFVTPEWVRLAGDAYAEALLGACERLASATASPPVVRQSSRKSAKTERSRGGT